MMEPTMETLLSAYHAKYTQQMRELAETLCAGTTRLESPNAIESRVLVQEVRRTAEKHGVDYETLGAAVADYTVIEQRALAQFRERGRPGV